MFNDLENRMIVVLFFSIDLFLNNVFLKIFNFVLKILRKVVLYTCGGYFYEKND